MPDPLAKRIKVEGLVPLVIPIQTADGRYRVVAGHIRVEACRRLRWHGVSAIISKQGEPACLSSSVTANASSLSK